MPMWLRTGNVNVTLSNGTVNGGSSSPNFITNGAKPGYIFKGPDARLYEILTVPSETQITITPNYLGSTASNQSYEIIQLSAAAYSQVLAAVNALLTELSTSIDATALKLGNAVETLAVLAARGTIVAFESASNMRVYASKAAAANNAWFEIAVAASGRARLGLIGNNNIVLQYSADGTTWTTVFTVDVTNALLTMTSHLIPRTFTVAALPATVSAGAIAYVSDLGGGGGLVRSDGTGWRRLDEGYETIATNADATLTALGNAVNIRHTGTLTVNRVLTLSTTGARAGARKRVTRTGAGAFTLSVGGLKLLSQNQWADVTYDGSAWYLSAFGSL